MPLFTEADRGLSTALRLDYTGIVAWASDGEEPEIGSLVLSPRPEEDDLLFLMRFREKQSGAIGLGTLPAGERNGADAVMRLILRLFKSGDVFFQRRAISAVFVPVDSPIAETAFYPFSVAMREGHISALLAGGFDNDRFMAWWSDISQPRFAEQTFRHLRSEFVSVSTTRIDLHAKLEEESDRGAAILVRFKAHTAGMNRDDCDRFWNELDWMMPGEIIRMAHSLSNGDDDGRTVRSYDDSEAFHAGSAQLENDGWAIESATSRWDGGWDVTYGRTKT